MSDILNNPIAYAYLTDLEIKRAARFPSKLVTHSYALAASQYKDPKQVADFFRGILTGCDYANGVIYIKNENGEDYLIYGEAKADQVRDRLKYARIDYNGKEGLVTMVDNATMKAYRMNEDHYYNGLVEPLEEIPADQFTFVRWCTSMDI